MSPLGEMLWPFGFIVLGVAIGVAVCSYKMSELRIEARLSLAHVEMLQMESDNYRVELEAGMAYVMLAKCGVEESDYFEGAENELAVAKDMTIRGTPLLKCKRIELAVALAGCYGQLYTHWKPSWAVQYNSTKPMNVDWPNL